VFSGKSRGQSNRPNGFEATPRDDDNNDDDDDDDDD